MVVSRGVAVGGKAACSGDGHRIVHAVENIHTAQIEHHAATDGQDQIDTPDPFGRGAEARVHLGTYRSRGLGGKHFHGSAYHGRKNGNGEEHDSQSANPLRHGTPEEQSVRQHFHFIDDGGTRRGESGNRLEESIGEIRDIAADGEGEGTEQTEYDPGERHQQIGITSA